MRAAPRREAHSFVELRKAATRAAGLVGRPVQAVTPCRRRSLPAPDGPIKPRADSGVHVIPRLGGVRSTGHVDADRVVLLIDHQLRTAIAGRRLIRFTYMKVSRVAEPHDYGIHNGALRLLVYQLRAKPFSRGWRMLDVAKIQSLVLLDQTFAGSRGAAYRTHLKWDRVFARVE
jgi:hypothetical protein